MGKRVAPIRVFDGADNQGSRSAVGENHQSTAIYLFVVWPTARCAT